MALLYCHRLFFIIMKGVQLIIILLISAISYGQSWDLIISSNEDEVLTDAIEDGDGNFVLCGYVGSYSLDEYDGYLVKISALGDTIFTKRFNNAYNYIKFDAIIEQVDGYIVFGSVKVDGAGYLNLMLKKTDKSFNEQWTKTYKNSNYTNEYFLNAKFDSNNDILAIGDAYHPVNNFDFFIYRFNSTGDSIDARYYAFSGPQFGFDIIEQNTGYKAFTYLVPDSSFLVSNEVVNIDFTLNIDTVVSLDTFPPVLDGGSFYANCRAKWINDSVYIAYARSRKSEYPFQDVQKQMGLGLLFLNTNDSILSSSIFGKADTAEIEAISGMDFIFPSAIYVGGTSNYVDWSWPSFANQKNWYNLNKIDNAGNVEWEKWYGGDANYYLWKVLATQDGGCLMIGTRYDSIAANGQQQRDVYVVKVDVDGIVSTGSDLQLTKSNFKIYPNPASEEFYIKGNFKLPATLELYDIMGRKVVVKSLNSNYAKIHINYLSKGIYVYRLISDDGKLGSGKLVIE